MKSLTSTRTQQIGKMASDRARKPRKPHCVLENFIFFIHFRDAITSNTFLDGGKCFFFIRETLWSLMQCVFFCQSRTSCIIVLTKQLLKESRTEIKFSMWYYSIIPASRKPQLNLHLLTCSYSRKAKP